MRLLVLNWLGARCAGKLSVLLSRLLVMTWLRSEGYGLLILYRLRKYSGLLSLLLCRLHIVDLLRRSWALLLIMVCGLILKCLWNSRLLLLNSRLLLKVLLLLDQW